METKDSAYQSEASLIRELTSHEELLEVEQIQREVWGMDDLEIVPAAQIRAVLHAGGQLAGAFLGERLVGFSYGFLARPHGRGMHGLGLHSHMVAVRQEARGRGVGQALKWDQRAWCLEHGLPWLTWTFDPLQARNANLNFRHLGAIGAEYLTNFYGPMGGSLGGGQQTDRLLALWLLDEPEVAGLAHGAAPSEVDVRGAQWALRAAGEGLLAEPSPQPLDAAMVAAGAPFLVAMPSDVTRLLATAPDLATRWRGALGSAMTTLFASGYAAMRVVDGAYLLTRLSSNDNGRLRM